MDSARSCFSCLHGENYGSGTGYGISACEYTLAGCLAICLICNDASVLVDLKSACCGGNQRIRGSAESHNDGINIDGVVGTFDLYRTASSGCIRLTELHLSYGHALDPALFIGQDLRRVR